MRVFRMVRVLCALLLLVLFILSFSLGGGVLAELLSYHFGPSLASVAAGWTAAAGMVVVGTLLATALFGRLYCSALCPLGSVQEQIGRFHKKIIFVPDLWRTRYVIAFLSLGFLVGGWAIGSKLFEPVTRTGSMITAVRSVIHNILQSADVGREWLAAVAGGLTLIAFIGLVVWKNRLYCSGICPIGTLLGLFSKFSLFRIRLTSKCTGCGNCARSCPTGCIDIKARQVDAERCVLCLACSAACRIGAIAYGRQRLPVSQPLNLDRRAFLSKSTAMIVGILALGYGMRGLTRSIATAGEAVVTYILPPGAGSSARFSKLCTGCHLCVANCPTRIIKPSLFGFGSVYIDYSVGHCAYDCIVCSTICPTGALERLTLDDKRYTRIGRAETLLTHCAVVVHGEPCDLCAKACPAGAIYMMDSPNGLSVPEVNAYHCIGCGACQSACPASPRAITVMALDEQELM